MKVRIHYYAAVEDGGVYINLFESAEEAQRQADADFEEGEVVYEGAVGYMDLVVEDCESVK